MDKVTRQCPQTTTFLKRKESRSGIEPRSFCLPAKPAHKALSVTLVTIYVTECTVCVPGHDPLTFLFLSSFLFPTVHHYVYCGASPSHAHRIHAPRCLAPLPPPSPPATTQHVRAVRGRYSGQSRRGSRRHSQAKFKKKEKRKEKKKHYRTTIPSIISLSFFC